MTSWLKLCGAIITEDQMLVKSFSTFHALNIVLQQQYKEQNFKRYSEIFSCLLVVEQNNEILMKNHQSHPTGSKPFLEVNGTFVQKIRKNHGYRYGINKWKGRKENPRVGSKHKNIHMKIRLPSENSCAGCSQNKLITKLSPSKVIIES